jgi:hypothetical protein
MFYFFHLCLQEKLGERKNAHGIDYRNDGASVGGLQGWPSQWLTEAQIKNERFRGR